MGPRVYLFLLNLVVFEPIQPHGLQRETTSVIDQHWLLEDGLPCE